MDENLNQNTQELAAELTIAWLSNSNTRAQAADVRDFLQSMYEAVSALVTAPAEGTSNEQAAVEYKPATTARRSLSSPEHIISFVVISRGTASHLSSTASAMASRLNTRWSLPLTPKCVVPWRRRLGLDVSHLQMCQQTRHQSQRRSLPSEAGSLLPIRNSAMSVVGSSAAVHEFTHDTHRH